MNIDFCVFSLLSWSVLLGICQFFKYLFNNQLLGLAYLFIAFHFYVISFFFPGGSDGSLPPMWETRIQSLSWKDTLEKEMAIHSSILAWGIPWTEKSGGLQSMGSQRVRHDWVTNTHFFFLIYFDFCCCFS